MNFDITDPGYLRWSVQGALLGSVSGNLAGLQAKLEAQAIQISAYFFTEPTMLDKELIEVIAAEVIANFTDDYTLATQCHLISEVVLNTVKWDFLRSEAYTLHTK